MDYIIKRTVPLFFITIISAVLQCVISIIVFVYNLFTNVTADSAVFSQNAELIAILGTGLFLVLFSVNMFITKGAARIAELNARSALDAVPMKMAKLDSQFDSGLITEKELTHSKKNIIHRLSSIGAVDGVIKIIKKCITISGLVTIFLCLPLLMVFWVKNELVFVAKEIGYIEFAGIIAQAVFFIAILLITRKSVNNFLKEEKNGQ